MKISWASNLVFGWVLLSSPNLSALENTTVGQVRFFNHANADYDPYTVKPDAAQQNWMRTHFERMLVYSPYFDERLVWFPNALAYIDSYAIYEGSDLAREHPEWIMTDAQGQKLYIPWNCKNGRCDQFAGDFSNPEFKAYMLNKMKTLIGKGYRGLWLDDVNLTWRVSNSKAEHVPPIDRNTGKVMTLAAWQGYFADYMETIRRTFPTHEIAHNAIWHAHGMDTENPYVSREIKAADYINLERGGSDQGLVAGEGTWGFQTFLSYIDYVHKLGTEVILMDYGTTEAEREYGLATWLLVNNGKDLISSNQLAWTAPDRYWQGYRVNLGAAMGDRYSWHGLLRRDFQCGMVLLNQPNQPDNSVEFTETYKNIAGQQLNRIQLPKKSAAVLQNNCPQH